MSSRSGRYTISYNGEIYNFNRIRSELEREAAIAWTGTSDTEVLLEAIERWGLQTALERSIGMFAFALWDAHERALHLVRDRLGVKPLSLAFSSEGVAFASELRSLTRFPGFQKQIDPVALSAYVECSHVPSTRAIYLNARKVAPGTILTLRGPTAGDLSETRWWSAAKAAQTALASPFRGTRRDAADALEELLRDAVGLRMVSDVPIGAFLSGGIDSSTVVSLMQALHPKPVHTFSIGSQSSQYDESASAALVARHLGTRHTELIVTPRMALEAVPKVAGLYDEPFADSSQIPTFLVAQLSRTSVTVALSGDGGDELFGGYNRHVWGPRIWNAVRYLPRGLRAQATRSILNISPERWDRLFERLGRFSPTRHPGSHLHKAALILDAANLQEAYRALTRQWSAGEVLTAPSDWKAPTTSEPVGGPSESLMFEDLMGYLPDDILTKVDRASMAVSLEAREPLLDHRLLSFSWSLPTRFKISENVGKRVLRDVLDRHVPREFTDRPKTGFGIPVGDWLRGDLKEWAWDLLRPEALKQDGLFRPDVVQAYWYDHQSGRRRWESRLWTVLMFQAWRASGGLAG